MALGILETRVDRGHVPGTAYIGADRTTDATDFDPNLKYDYSGPNPIVLVPQPSNDPNDPLNWPLWRRDVITGLLCMVSVLAATLSPLLAANTITLAEFWGRPFTEVALLTGWHLCGVGVAGVLCVPSARVWGKRHLFVLGTLLLVLSSAWGGAAQSYKSLLWSRIIQGFAVAPFESLVNAAIGDLYCVHQRGKRMALTNFSLFGGAFFTPVIVGKMTSTLGWRWPFYFVAILSGLMLPLVFFFVPETAFCRPYLLDTDLASREDIIYVGKAKHTDSGGVQEAQSTELNILEGGSSGNMPSIAKATFVQQLSLFSGRKTDDSLFKMILRPFPLFLHPAVLWASVTQGVLIGWTVMIGVVLGAIFMGPPLWFGEEKTGYMYTGAFVGATCGFLAAGPLADWSARFLTKQNKGVYEPEFRIVLIIPQAIFGVVGIFGFGLSSANVYKYHWFWPSFFFGFEVAGMVIGAIASALYLVDAHRDIAIESFTCQLLFKNFFSFALTWKAYGWLNKIGVWKLFWIVGVVQIILCILSVPMYLFGKKNRWFMHQHDILKALGLR